MAFLQNAFYEGEAIAYQEGLSTDFLTDLGFTIPPVLDDFVHDAEGSQAFIPLEQLSVLDDADVLLWATEQRGRPGHAGGGGSGSTNALEEVGEGSPVFTDGLLAGAIYSLGPASASRSCWSTWCPPWSRRHRRRGSRHRRRRPHGGVTITTTR